MDSVLFYFVPLAFGLLGWGTTDLLLRIGLHRRARRLSASDQASIEQLLTEETIYRFLRSIFFALERELKRPKNIKRLYRLSDIILPELLDQVVNGYLRDLAIGRHPDFKTLAGQFYDRTLPHVRLDYRQAELLMDAVFNMLITPDYIRRALIDALTGENIKVIEQAIQSRTGGLKGLLMKFVDLDRGLGEIRDFLYEHPAEANRLVLEWIDRLELREKLAEKIAVFSVEDLPPEVRQTLITYLGSMTLDLLVDYRTEIAGLVSGLSREASRAVAKSLIKTDYRSGIKSIRPELGHETAAFVHGYLKQELGAILRSALPVLEGRRQRDAMDNSIHKMLYARLSFLPVVGGFLGILLGFNVLLLLGR